MRQAGQLHVGDLAPNQQIYDLAVLAIPGRADQVVVGWVKEEVVEVVIQLDAPHRKRPGCGYAFAIW